MRKGSVLLVVAGLVGAVAVAVVAQGQAEGKTAKKKASAEPKAPPPPDPAELFDATAIKGKLAIYTDGNGHYLSSAPDLSDDALRGLLFYSNDGKTFWQQRVGGYGSSGKDSFDYSFWEPRVNDGWRRSFARKGNDYNLMCDDRKTAFQPLAADQQKAMLDGATFMKPRWKYMAYALARDDAGTYFYVDKPREPQNSKAFRLFMGKKGALKPLKMVNVVSDSEGDIFATKSGELRLIIPKEGGGGGYDPVRREPLWIKGKKKTPLTWVPVENNVRMIYEELGVYAGQPLGTPCDDL